jgi:hypothetical protein
MGSWEEYRLGEIDFMQASMDDMDAVNPMAAVTLKKQYERRLPEPFEVACYELDLSEPGMVAAIREAIQSGVDGLGTDERYVLRQQVSERAGSAVMSQARSLDRLTIITEE